MTDISLHCPKKWRISIWHIPHYTVPRSCASYMTDISLHCPKNWRVIYDKYLITLSQEVAHSIWHISLYCPKKWRIVYDRYLNTTLLTEHPTPQPPASHSKALVSRWSKWHWASVCSTAWIFPVKHPSTNALHHSSGITDSCQTALPRDSVSHKSHTHKKTRIFVYALSRSHGIATHYWLDGPGIETPVGRDFPHPFRPPQHPPSLPYNGYRASLPGVNGPGRGADHPPTSSTEVKKRIQLHF